MEIDKGKNKEEGINDFLDEKLDKLKKSVLQGRVVKGIKQTIKAIMSGKAEEVYLCKNNNLGDRYNSVITNYAQAYMAGKEPIIISNFLILRDIVMNQYISNTLDIKGKRIGRDFKEKGPKCYCAAIVFN